MSRPRVVLVSRQFWPLVGGPEVTLTRLGVGLHTQGVAVTVLSVAWQSDWPTTFEDRGVHVVRLPPPPDHHLADLTYVARLARWLREHHQEFDVVCVSGLRHEAYAALTASRKTRLPVILRAEHAGLSGDCHWQLTARCGRRIKRRCQQAAVFVAPSASVERELIAAGYARDRLRMIVTGVPIPAASTAQERFEARSALAQADPHLALPGSGPLIVHVGRLLAEAKGLGDLLQAWRKVCDERPDARLWLVGDGPDAAQLRDQVVRLGLAASVAFAGAFDDAGDFLQAADMFVMPARENRSSLALIEAMSHSLPIVATTTPETQATIEHARQGWLVRPADPPALADGILHLLRNPQLAAELSGAARQRACADFNFQRVVEQHLSLFDEILARTRKSIAVSSDGP